MVLVIFVLRGPNKKYIHMKEHVWSADLLFSGGRIDKLPLAQLTEAKSNIRQPPPLIII